MRVLKTTVLGALAGLSLIAAPAHAQVQMPGWFGSVSGWWYPWSNNGDSTALSDSGESGKWRPDDGWGGKAYMGYRFGMYDIAIGGQGTLLGWKNSSHDVNGTPIFAKQKANYWAVDGEFGYNGTMNSLGYRVFIGARYAEFDHRLKGVLFDNSYPIRLYEDFSGFGPRIGFAVVQRLGNGGFSIFADAAGAYLFGQRKARAQGNFGDPEVRHRTAGADTWNAEGQIGVLYEIFRNVTFSLGYRGEYWSNVHADNYQVIGSSAVWGSADRLMHGPFARVAYNIGAPRPAPAAAPPAPAPAAVMTKNFIVFFDFDRSNLTAQAQNTIREAAAASKTGGVQRVNVTGHADKSGGDAYNMALSLRRANTVKDELVRNGVPANAIVVVARGETQPLVPTADGVREPQNRRVEIVLN